MSISALSIPLKASFTVSVHLCDQNRSNQLKPLCHHFILYIGHYGKTYNHYFYHIFLKDCKCQIVLSAKKEKYLDSVNMLCYFNREANTLSFNL